VIQISIQIEHASVAGASEADQLASAMAALGFYRPESLTTAPAATLAPVEQAPADFAEKPKGRGRPKAADKAATPPADPVPSEAAQDAADETAEKEAAKAEEKPAEGAAKVYDVNDMRAAGKAYADAYGMPACLKDIPAIIGFAAFSQVPADKIDDVTRAVLAAVEQNPYDHPRA
jgi:hypothetical protein